MERLAIHQSDIATFKLPPQSFKVADSRAAGFRDKYGAEAATVELDALPAAELRRRIVEAVTGLIDFGKWDRQVEVQEIEFECIERIAAQFKPLPQLSAQELI